MAETVLASLEQLQKIAAKNKEISDNLTGRLETIEKVGPQANVLEGVKVNGKALAIVQKMVDILVTTGAADGTIQVNGVDVSVKGLAQMAYKAQVSQGGRCGQGKAGLHRLRHRRSDQAHRVLCRDGLPRF